MHKFVLPTFITKLFPLKYDVILKTNTSYEMFLFLKFRGTGLFLPSQVPEGSPSTVPPPLSPPPTSSPPVSSWPPLLRLGLSGPPWPRCTLPVLSQHTLRQGVDIDRQWSQEDVPTLVSQKISRCGQLLPQHKSGRVHVDLRSLCPNYQPQRSAARQKIEVSWPVDPPTPPTKRIWWVNCWHFLLWFSQTKK